jgi:hypothetical protein
VWYTVSVEVAVEAREPLGRECDRERPREDARPPPREKATWEE